MHLKIRYIIVAVIVLAVVGGGLWLISSQAQAALPDTLTASGTIEAVQIDVASETGGRVTEVFAKEGDRVTAGQTVVQLDDALLQAQIEQAQTALAAAQAQREAAQASYDLLKAGAQVDQIAAAEEQVRAAEAQVSGAEAQLGEVRTSVRSADVAAAEADVAQAAAQLKVARDRHDETLKCYKFTKPDGTKDSVCPLLGTPEEQARAALNAAQQAYDAAQARLKQVQGGATVHQVNAAQAQVAAAQAQQGVAQAQLDQLKAGARPEQLKAAQAAIDSAKAQITAAQANLKMLQLQQDKLTLTAPNAGVVLARAIQPGEVAMPGATLLTIGQIDSLSIIVYVPEDQYGQIKLGQTAQVKVDSFPGETFTATVTYISDQAEFTPRNVQTSEERATTVYAVKLAIDNAAGKLKPGMPADVTFQE
jgi:HlyD family secretion protein